MSSLVMGIISIFVSLTIINFISVNVKTFARQVNLISNPSFEIGDNSIGRDYNQNGWTFFIIEEPAKGVVKNDAKDGNACFEIQAEKGYGFLHSDPFLVNQSSSFKINVWIKGSGEGSIEILWWKEYNDDIVIESDHHRDVLKKFNATNSWQQVNAEINVPKDAKFAYIRLVARKANICFDDISVIH